MTVKWKKTAVFIIILLLISSLWLIFKEKGEESGEHTVAMVSGTTYHSIARRLLKVKELKHYSDVNQVLNGTVNGEADVAIVDRLAGLNLLQQDQYRKLKLSGDLLEPRMVVNVFNREDGKLRQEVNRALTEIIHNGTYARISRRYFGCDILQGWKRKALHPNEPMATDDSWNRVQQAGEINLAMKGDNPPFNYNNEQHELSGFDVELAQAICKYLGLKLVVFSATADMAIEGLRARYYDGMWGYMEITEEQRKDIDFSDPDYITGPQLIIKDSFLNNISVFEKYLKPPVLPPLRL
jgi:ABC-type amino acid transport substrate-binding protein